MSDDQRLPPPPAPPNLNINADALQQQLSLAQNALLLQQLHQLQHANLFNLSLNPQLAATTTSQGLASHQGPPQDPVTQPAQSIIYVPVPVPVPATSTRWQPHFLPPILSTMTATSVTSTTTTTASSSTSNSVLQPPPPPPVLRSIEKSSRQQKSDKNTFDQDRYSSNRSGRIVLRNQFPRRDSRTILPKKRKYSSSSSCSSTSPETIHRMKENIKRKRREKERARTYSMRSISRKPMKTGTKKRKSLHKHESYNDSMDLSDGERSELLAKADKISSSDAEETEMQGHTLGTTLAQTVSTKEKSLSPSKQKKSATKPTRSPEPKQSGKPAQIGKKEKTKLDFSNINIDSDYTCSDDEYILQCQKSLPTIPYKLKFLLESQHYHQISERQTTATQNNVQYIHSAFLKWQNFIDQCRAAQPANPSSPPQPQFNACKCGDNDATSCSEAEGDLLSIGKNVSKKRALNKKQRTELMLSRKQQMARDETQRKLNDPARLHARIWHNEPALMNDSLACRCSYAARQYGARHQAFAGEQTIPLCDPMTNNVDKLYHYIMKIRPLTNIKPKSPTAIKHGKSTYTFDGFSIFTHRRISSRMPPCLVNKWGHNYYLHVAYIDRGTPPNSCVGECNIFHRYIFEQLLELYDVKWRPHQDVSQTGCTIVHTMPRFVHIDEVTRERVLLPMSVVLNHFTQQVRPIDKRAYQLRNQLKTQLVCNPKTKPCTIRCDGIHMQENCLTIKHFARQPSQLSAQTNPRIMRLQRKIGELEHSMRDRSAPPTKKELDSIANMKRKISDLRSNPTLANNQDVHLDAQGFYSTGIYVDVVHHACMLLALVQHLRYHQALSLLEEEHLRHTFRNRQVLELALTHPSYRATFGVNCDHARNTLNNCGTKFIEFGNGGPLKLSSTFRKEHSAKPQNLTTAIYNNERLEFLGDAALELVTTSHLFFLLEQADEGALATLRSALVQNRYLAILAQRMSLHQHLLLSHGADLSHEADIRHALANAFEAICGALFLDAGLDKVDEFVARAFYPPETQHERYLAWTAKKSHILQRQYPKQYSDYEFIAKSKFLKLVDRAQNRMGIKFRNIRLMARAMTRSCVPYNLMTLGDNQRMEFLGDSVLQLLVSEYLYKHFPLSQEGHLSMLRSSLVNNETQSQICTDLGLVKLHQSIYSGEHAIKFARINMKDKADLVEALIGASYIDSGLTLCRIVVRVCFLSRLQHFIDSQKWTDAKSKLQQAVLTWKNELGKHSIPTYRLIEQHGSSNDRHFRVAVYYRNTRLSDGDGPTILSAEMKAAENALLVYRQKMHQLKNENKIIGKSTKKQAMPTFKKKYNSSTYKSLVRAKK